MTPQGIASAAQTAQSDVSGAIASVEKRLSSIESKLVTLVESAETKYAKYLIPVASGLVGLIVGHLI